MFSSLCVSVLFLFHWDELWLLSPWLQLLILLLLLSPCVPQQLALLHPLKPVCSFAILPTPCSCLPVFPGLWFGSPWPSAAVWLCPVEQECLLFPGHCPRPGSELGCFLLCPSASSSFPGLTSTSAAVAFTLAPDPLPIPASPCWVLIPFPRPQQLFWAPALPCSAPSPLPLPGPTAAVVVPLLHLLLLAPLPTSRVFGW